MATTDVLKSRILSVYGVTTSKQSDQILKSNEDVIFGQESFTLDVNSLKHDLIKKAKDYEIKKSFELLESDLDLEKGMGRAGLHPQKITVHTKDGGTYQAIRWISSDSGKAASINGFKPEDEHTGATAGDKINNIVTGVHSNKDKVKHLIGMGIYDRKHLANLVDDGYARQFTKQADLNPKEFNDVELDENGEIKDAEAVLTSNDPKAGNKYKPEIDITMSMEDAEEALSTKDFEKYKKKLVESMREKFGITADKMWLSYERNIVRLIETGQPKSMLVFGTGGVGKTYTLEQVLDRENLKMYQVGLDMEPDYYDAIKITGSTSKTGLWRKLFENREKFVIFDDCDSLWDDSDCLNWLKGALDSSGDGTINYDQGDRIITHFPLVTPRTRNTDDDGFEDVDNDVAGFCPKEFRFTGKVIFISNLTSSQLVKKGAGPLVESRCLAIDLTMNLEKTMDKLGKIKNKIIIKDNKGNAIPGITQEDRDMAYNFMNEMKGSVPVSKINGRTLGNLIGTAANLRRTNQLTPENFVDEALVTFLS